MKTNERAKLMKLKAIKYLGGNKCFICGRTLHPDLLEFHHLGNKSMKLSEAFKRYSWDRVKEEVDKCVLLCHDCHVKLHKGEVMKSEEDEEEDEEVLAPELNKEHVIGEALRMSKVELPFEGEGEAGDSQEDMSLSDDSVTESIIEVGGIKVQSKSTQYSLEEMMELQVSLINHLIKLGKNDEKGII